MNFSTDRDLLAYEPTVFADVPVAAQQRVDVDDGALVDTTLSSSAADFAAAHVQRGRRGAGGRRDAGGAVAQRSAHAGGVAAARRAGRSADPADAGVAARGAGPHLRAPGGGRPRR